MYDSEVNELIAVCIRSFKAGGQRGKGKGSR